MKKWRIPTSSWLFKGPVSWFCSPPFNTQSPHETMNNNRQCQCPFTWGKCWCLLVNYSPAVNCLPPFAKGNGTLDFRDIDAERERLANKPPTVTPFYDYDDFNDFQTVYMRNFAVWTIESCSDNVNATGSELGYTAHAVVLIKILSERCGSKSTTAFGV